MPRMIPPKEDEKPKSIDPNQERYFIETLLVQRINFFIIFFLVLIVLAIVASNLSSYYLTIVLSVGTIICWGLTLNILKLSLRLKFLDGKESTNVSATLIKLPFKILSWLSDIFIPVLCSILITIGLFLSTSGYFDTKLIPQKVQEKVEEGLKLDKDTLKKVKQPERIKEFKSIDSVIQ